MSKQTRRKKSHAAANQRIAQQRAHDRGIYAVIIMVGLFGLLLWWLAAYETFPHAVIGYVAAVLGFINWAAFKAFLGKPLANWEKALARLPLQFANYGTKKGKPLEAAQGQENARMVLMTSLSISIIIMVGLTLLLLR